MQIFFIIVSSCFLGIAVFNLLSIICSAPSGKQTLAAYKIQHSKQKQTSVFDKVQTVAAVCISKMPIKPLIDKIQPLLEYDKKHRTAEEYLAGCLLKMVFITLLGIVGGFVFPPLFLVCMIAPAAIYYDEYSQLKSLNEKKREAIEKDLPSFVSAVLVSLSSDRDIVRMILTYIPYATFELKKELQITVSDMQSGNYERALMRLDQRVCSSHMSAVVRGLIGISRGNDERTYFQLLAHSIRQAELTRQKQKALKVKPKFMIAAGILLLSCLLLIFGVLLIDLSAKSKELFG